eukprot:1152362-Pelagomonas_calceolata.AAC.1
MCPRSARLGALTGRGSNPARPARLAGHGHPGMRPCGARLRALIGKAGLARPARLAGCYPGMCHCLQAFLWALVGRVGSAGRAQAS